MESNSVKIENLDNIDKKHEENENKKEEENKNNKNDENKKDNENIKEQKELLNNNNSPSDEKVVANSKEENKNIENENCKSNMENKKEIKNNENENTDNDLKLSYANSPPTSTKILDLANLDGPNEQTDGNNLKANVLKHSLSPTQKININNLLITENYFEANATNNSNNNSINKSINQGNEKVTRRKSSIKRRKNSLVVKDQLEEINEYNQKVLDKIKKNKEVNIDEFYSKKRHFLIMTQGGKPIYSRYGDEMRNCGIFATLSAMITKYTVFLNEDEFINTIKNDKVNIVFLKKGQIIYIVLSKTNDNLAKLYSQLEYLYNQLMSILSNHFYLLLEDNPLTCLASLNGTDILFENMIRLTTNTINSLINSYPVLPNKFHDQILKLCNDNLGDALVCIIMTPHEVIGVSHVEGIPIKASDIILLQNLIFSSPSLRNDESWSPLCLPGISPDGYLQLYCNINDSNIAVCLLTDSVDPAYFMKFAEQYNDIVDSLLSSDLINKIIKAEIVLNKFDEKTEAKKKINDDEELKIKLRSIDYLPEEQLCEELMEKFGQKSTKTFKNSYFDRRSNTIMPKNNSFSNKESVHPIFLDNNNNNKSVMDDIIYGICKNKKMSQHFLINLNNNFFKVSKDEKKLYNEYSYLYDKLAEFNKQEDNNKTSDFFYYTKGERYSNIICQSGNFILIASFNYFSVLEDIEAKVKNIIKYIKDNEHDYFILFK